MRAAIVVAALTVPIMTVGYYVIYYDSANEKPRLAAAQPAPDAALTDRLDQLTASLQAYQQAHQAQRQQTREQQTRLHDTLTALDTRLRSVEQAAADRATAEAQRAAAEPTADMDMTDTDTDTDSDDPKPVAETELGRWMDESLQLGYFDRESTKQAMEQAANALTKSPDVILDDMRCGDGFCRATFFNVTGERPEIGELFGEPPFMTEGFTVEQPDGRVVLYFTQPGESLQRFRDDLQAFNLGYTVSE